MKGKLFSRLISILLILVLSFSLAACSNNDAENNAVNDGNSTNISDANGYVEKLFDTSYVHAIDITISEDDWNDLTENPLDKTKYEVNITIDGETIESVSFATKGNTSLSSVAGDADSDRYSFKVNFGKYNKEQTYYGLNKLNLNNIYADATYMKDYLSYEIFRQAGVDSPLVSYVWLTINGEDHGLYIAIEDISEGYLNRVCDGEGELYKPETEQLANMGQAGGYNSLIIWKCLMPEICLSSETQMVRTTQMEITGRSFPETNSKVQISRGCSRQAAKMAIYRKCRKTEHSRMA